MSEIILVLHIASGITAILTSLSSFFTKLNKLTVIFWPSVSLVSLTGIGLMFTGVSIVRVCTSGIILTVSLVFIKYLANNRAVLDKVHSRFESFLDI